MYCKLQSLIFSAGITSVHALPLGHKSKQEKLSFNLQYELWTWLVRGMYQLFWGKKLSKK